VYQDRAGAAVFDIQIDAAEAASGRAGAEPSIPFPDKDLLFSADFKRSGTDLLLAGQDTTAVILDYFRDGRRLNIATLEGASLTGAAVEVLAGPDASGQYAQAGMATPTRTPIGRVEKVSGSVTVLRNGVPVELRLGDTVAKGDVVQTGADSSLTIKLNDGTVFSLSSSARMVLNDMVYSADSTANSALFTLVQGVIGFVAGRVAKSGDLKVDTPIATMAIRGTAVQTEIAAFSGVTKFSLLTEPDGTVGSFVLLDKNNPSRVIASLSDARVATLLTPVAGSDPQVSQITKTADDIRGENGLVQDMFRFFSTENLQRRGSSDFEKGALVPINLPQRIDPPDLPHFSIAPFIPHRLAPREPIVPTRAIVLEAVRGTAVEDGPLAQLDILTGAGATLPFMIVPASLPPGVRYLDGSRNFTLDPSHPAYQHLGEGETETVHVDYSMVTEDGIRILASASWTVVGQNDAPVAAVDRITDVGEVGRRILDVRANDSDVDGDPLQIIRWTAPLEGSLSLNASGDLVFDPGDDFQALSSGQTATVSFTYTISDDQGATDTETATVQVHGAGTFTSPHRTASTSGTLGFNGQSISLTMDAPSATTTTEADLDLIIGLGPLLQPQMNILYLIDVSGSTSELFEGTPVDDLNDDGSANTILDAEIAGLIALTERIRGLGFSPADVSITIIPFNGSANPTEAANPGGVNAATFSLGSAGENTIANYLRGLDAGGPTNFADALRAANARLQDLDQGGEENFLYFLSDGNGQGSFDSELATLNDVYRAKITAIGIGESASLAQLNSIDNTGGASRMTAPGQIDISVLGAPLSRGTVADLDIFVNGVAVAGIDREDLASTPDGYVLDASMTGLRRLAGDHNTVSAVVTFASGEILTTELTIAGALPRSTDHIL